MKYQFSNTTHLPIPSPFPGVVRSTVRVAGVEGRIRDVRVTLNVHHTFTGDLKISLVGPDGDQVILVEGEGGKLNHFVQTTFDEIAPRCIAGALAPFHGPFRPEESLSRFREKPANGEWTLEIVDASAFDGGCLEDWLLEIDTDPASADDQDYVRFESKKSQEISAVDPNVVVSEINVTGLDDKVVADVRVLVDVKHSFDSDLTLTLIAPGGQPVTLADRRGGSREDYRSTVFDDSSSTPIGEGKAPFTGRYRPESSLATLHGTAPNGRWKLELRDHEPNDGGILHRWALDLKTRLARPPRGSGFTVEVRFLGGLSAAQEAVFEQAAAFWEHIILGDLPDVQTDLGTVDDVVIDAEGRALDGSEGILGQAGPTALRPGSFLPARGTMSFDSADLAEMEEAGTLFSVIVHEMGHVLGFGTLWSRHGLLVGAGTPDPVFVGQNAMREYATLIGSDEPVPVPVANRGGPGTRDGHWRESVFGNELMTGFIDQSLNPLSRVSIASLADLGYQVRLEAAEPYSLPTPAALAAFLHEGAVNRRRCRTNCPEAEVLPG